MEAVSRPPVQIRGTLSSLHTDLLYAGSKWQQLAAHLQRLVEPFRHSELAYKERKGKLLWPGWLALGC